MSVAARAALTKRLAANREKLEEDEPAAEGSAAPRTQRSMVSVGSSSGEWGQWMGCMLDGKVSTRLPKRFHPLCWSHKQHADAAAACMVFTQAWPPPLLLAPLFLRLLTTSPLPVLGSLPQKLPEASEDSDSSQEGLGADITETWMIMEYCDKGSLERAIFGGRFKRKDDACPEMVSTGGV